jgi:hypothetical protein
MNATNFKANPYNFLIVTTIILCIIFYPRWARPWIHHGYRLQQLETKILLNETVDKMKKFVNEDGKPKKFNVIV